MMHSVCESYIGKPIGTRAVPQFTTGVAKPLTQYQAFMQENWAEPVGCQGGEQWLDQAKNILQANSTEW